MKNPRKNATSPTPARTSFFSLFFFGFAALAPVSPALACGLYEVTGMVRGKAYEYRIVVGEGTKSQTVFTPVFKAQPRLFPYGDTFVKATVLLTKPIDGTRATVAAVESIALALPDPLHMAESSQFRLVQKQECANPRK